MTTNQYRYWQKRKAGLCVACKAPAEGKSRCPACMKRLTEDSAKSRKRKLERLEDRIRELEGLSHDKHERE